MSYKAWVWRACAALALAVVTATAFPLSAHAAATFSDRVPAPGATVTTSKPTVQVRATEPSFPLSTVGSILYLDGSPVTTVHEYPIGHMELDDWGYVDVWVVDDYRVMLLTGTPSLADGWHTVRAVARNGGGADSEDSWSFRVAEPPVADQMAPGGSVSTRTPTISARVRDNSAGPVSVTMRLDGSVVPATLNSVTGMLTYTPASLLASGQSHTVRLDMTDAEGNASTTSWSFFVQATPTANFYSLSPAPRANVTNPTQRVALGVTGTYDLPITGSWPSYTSPVLYVDGSVSTNPSVTRQPATNLKQLTIAGDFSSLADGSHHVRVTVRDSTNTTHETAWGFTVAVPPSLTSPAPANGTRVLVPRPTIGFDVRDNTPGPVTTRLWLDGVKVMDAPMAQGRVTWTPSADLASDGATHDVEAQAVDAAGNATTLRWSFRSALPMTLGENCLDCHAGYPGPHPMDGCEGCHSYQTETPVKPGGSCLGAECHGSWEGSHGSDLLGSRQCTECHSSAWPSIPRHTDASIAPRHVTTTSCFQAACHDTSLVTEHGKYPAASAFKYQCTVCHTSPDARVRAAIAGAQTGCDSCHALERSHLSLHGDGFSGTGCSGAGCHDANLVTEHVGSRSIACAGCHDSTTPAVVAAIAGHDRSCGACHEDAGHLAVHDNGFADASCARCHTANIMTEHITRRAMRCEACHAAGVAPRPLALSAAAGGLRPLAAGAATGGASIRLAYASPSDVTSAVANGVTSCTACHAPMPHGIRTDCETCHGFVPPTTNGTEPTATAPGYTSWDASGANAAVPTPHKGYTLTTTKCGVCHSVHHASAAGEALLRGTAEAACEYCHVYTATGRVVIYGGDAANYYAIDDGDSHNRTSHSRCGSCHSVHGARTVGGANADKILWDWPATGRSRYSTEALAVWSDPSAEGDDDAQITAWCTGCHAYYTAAYNDTLDMQGFDHQQSYDVTWTVAASHVMTDLAGGYTNPSSTLAPGTQVAYAPSTYCRSCHDAGNTDQGPGVHADSFPHDTPGYWRFMTAGASVLASGSTNTTPTIDGLCLKCHRDGANGGVGEGW